MSFNKDVKKQQKKTYNRKTSNHTFEVILFVVFVALVIYRVLGLFPEWFDEVFAKALLFGFPSLLYLKSRKLDPGFSFNILFRGLFLGLAIGGLFGFSGVLASMFKGTQIQPFNLFLTASFIYLFIISLFTSFWESVFFFGFVQNALSTMIKRKSLSLLFTVVFTALVFVVFHAPIIVINFGVTLQVLRVLVLLFFFALGQSLFYSRSKNMYALVLSYTFWGMVLALYSF